MWQGCERSYFPFISQWFTQSFKKQNRWVNCHSLLVAGLKPTSDSSLARVSKLPKYPSFSGLRWTAFDFSCQGALLSWAKHLHRLLDRQEKVWVIGWPEGLSSSPASFPGASSVYCIQQWDGVLTICSRDPSVKTEAQKFSLRARYSITYSRIYFDW